MTALAGSGVAVTNPVANSAAAANPIGSFMVKSSIWDSSNMRARPAAGKGAKGHRTIHSYTTALYRLLATRRCLTAYAWARGTETRVPSPRQAPAWRTRGRWRARTRIARDPPTGTPRGQSHQRARNNCSVPFRGARRPAAAC